MATEGAAAGGPAGVPAEPTSAVTVSEEDAKAAVGFKEKGNDFFKQKKFPQAIEWYTKAIETDPTVAAYWGNRAYAYILSEANGAAVQDAEKAIQLDRSYVKAYYRRGEGLLQLGKHKEARRDFEAVAKARPKDAKAKKKFDEVDKLIKRLAFEKAIRFDEPAKAPLSVRLKDIAYAAKVDTKYDGPSLDKHDEISPEFVQSVMEWFRNQKVLSRRVALMIILRAAELFEATGNLPDIPIASGGKITICGDTHGQFFDLLNIFKINGMPSETNPYVFNGDFVDRGSFSTEVIFTMLCWKCAYPNHFHMSRGNHETINMNKMYGFEGEVKAKYNASFQDYFTDLYNVLPLGHIIHQKVMVVHGGLFEKDGVKLEDIRKIDRVRQPDDGLMCQMLWSDPQEQMGRSPSKRGVACQFGPDVTEAFLKDNNLELLIRSHEVKDAGYEVVHGGKCITIFSAPNYCDQIGNKGAFLHLREDCVPEFHQFDAVPHPNVKPMAYAGAMGSMFGM